MRSLKFRPIVLMVSTLVSKTKSPGSNPGGPATNEETSLLTQVVT